MPRKVPVPLPEPLGYLQPFVRSLARLPPEALNEDVDASRLEVALRKRLRGLDEAAAEFELAGDRGLLETWLKTDAPEDHPAYWVLGYLSLPALASTLVQPPRPPVQGPQMTFEAPPKWKVTPAPFRLDLKRGKVVGSIMAIDESTSGLLRRQREQIVLRPEHEAIGLRAERQALDVTYGPCAGKKYLYVQTAPGPWKEVDYVLAVPGGYVSIRLGTLTGADFEESGLESKLHTLRLAPRE